MDYKEQQATILPPPKKRCLLVGVVRNGDGNVVRYVRDGDDGHGDVNVSQRVGDGDVIGFNKSGQTKRYSEKEINNEYDTPIGSFSSPEFPKIPHRSKSGRPDSK